jgi:hypothetical protein
MKKFIGSGALFTLVMSITPAFAQALRSRCSLDISRMAPSIRRTAPTALQKRSLQLICLVLSLCYPAMVFLLSVQREPSQLRNSPQPVRSQVGTLVPGFVVYAVLVQPNNQIVMVSGNGSLARYLAH